MGWGWSAGFSFTPAPPPNFSHTLFIFNRMGWEIRFSTFKIICNLFLNKYVIFIQKYIFTNIIYANSY